MYDEDVFALALELGDEEVHQARLGVVVRRLVEVRQQHRHELARAEPATARDHRQAEGLNHRVGPWQGVKGEGWTWEWLTQMYQKQAVAPMRPCLFPDRRARLPLQRQPLRQRQAFSAEVDTPIRVARQDQACLRWC